MPFLTHDLPRGGRHVAPPAAAPLASARTRLRQLLPVGLLVAASSAAAVAMPMVEGAAPADGSHSDRHGATATGATGQPSQTGSTQALTPTHSLSAAAFAQPAAGRHRAAGLADTARPSTAAGGRHRADLPEAGTTGASAAAQPGQTAQPGQASQTRHGSPTSHAAKQPTGGATATTAPKPTDGATPPSSDPTGGNTGAAGSTGSSGSTSSPTGSPSNGDLVGTVTGTLGGVLGGVGDTVGGLLGAGN